MAKGMMGIPIYSIGGLKTGIPGSCWKHTTSTVPFLVLTIRQGLVGGARWDLMLATPTRHSHASFANQEAYLDVIRVLLVRYAVSILKI